MIANEVLQWVMLVVLAVLLLGAYRQLAVFLGHGGADRLDSRAGPAIGRRVPAPLVTALRAGGIEAGTQLIFISETCRGCQRLLAEMSEHQPEVPTALVLPPGASVGLRAAVAEIHDVSSIVAAEEAWAKSNVTTTPLILSTDSRWIVREKVVSHTLRNVDHRAGTGTEG